MDFLKYKYGFMKYLFFVNVILFVNFNKYIFVKKFRKILRWLFLILRELLIF